MRTATIHFADRDGPAPPSLDPCTLGRPIHLLDGFIQALKADLADHLQQELNRRYGASFDVGTVTLVRGVPPDARIPRLLVHGEAGGSLGFALERTVLLGVMAYRYGDDAIASASGAAARETVTEERLAAHLGARLVRLLVARINAGSEPVLPDATETSVHAVKLTPVATARAGAGTWSIRADVRESVRGIEGALWFTLDEAWMRRLLRRLTPVRDKPVEPVQRALPLAMRLQLTMTGQLLRKELLLGELMELRVGDVIPISLGATDVLIDDSRLFTATVAEQKGKLCLTSFEFVE